MHQTILSCCSSPSLGKRFAFALVLLFICATTCFVDVEAFMSRVQACDFYAGNWGKDYECDDQLCNGACSSFNDIEETGSGKFYFISVTPEIYDGTSTVDPLTPKMDICGEVGGPNDQFDWLEQWQFGDEGWRWRWYPLNQGSPFPASMLSYNTTRITYVYANTWCFHAATWMKTKTSTTSDIDDLINGGSLTPAQLTRYNWNTVTCSSTSFHCPVETCSAYGQADHGTADVNCPAGTRSLC